MTPAYFASLPPSLPAQAFNGLIEAVPGVRISRAGKLIVPENALDLVQRKFAQNRLPFTPRPLSSNLAPINYCSPYDNGVHRWLDTGERGFTLTAYQRKAGEAWARKNGVLFWWPPGAGKTVGALLWARSVTGKVVYLTRASAKRQAIREIQRFSDLKVVEVKGEKPWEPDLSADVVVCGWEVLPHQVRSLIAFGAVTLIGDEVHRVKNPKRWEAVQGAQEGEVDFIRTNNITGAAAVLGRAVPRVLGATGTPIADRPRDLWGIFDFITGGGFGGFIAFAKRYCDARPGQYGGLDTSGRAAPEVMAELYQRIEGLTFKVTSQESHGDLPPMRRLVTSIPVEDLIKAQETATEKKQADRGPNDEKLKHKLMVAAGRKRPVLVAKALEALENMQKVVIFTGRKKDVSLCHDALVAAIAKSGALRDTQVRIWASTGDDSRDVRDTIQTDYMAAPGPAVLVATAQAWGESLNLNDTDYALMGMLPITWQQFWQWERRFFRRGQKRSVLVEYLVAEGTYDEDMAAGFLEKLPAVADMGDADAADADNSFAKDADAAARSILNKLFAAGDD